jgi:DNA-binding beta-propeller fold protein YncE
VSRRQAIAIAAPVVVLCACAPSGAGRPAATALPPAWTASAAPTSSPAVATLDTCPAPQALDAMHPLSRLGGGPDDAVATLQGDIWISLHDSGRIVELGSGGQMLRSIPDPEGPEGIEALAGGRLLVAQQDPDRVDLLDPQTGAFTTWLQLEPAAAGEGIDGLGIDGDALLVPDSAGGRLLLVPIAPDDAAGSPQALAAGLGRPVSAWPMGGGRYAVAVENAPGLIEVSGAGIRADLVHQTSLDDVVERDGILYATDLAGNRLEAIDPRSGVVRVLVSGAPDPQGLTITATGTLVLVDEDAGLVETVPSCG